ncbi:MAG: hypothetical protein P8164_02315 [Gammaproteobacteria bacterium]|jgi:hypothetical protein
MGNPQAHGSGHIDTDSAMTIKEIPFASVQYDAMRRFRKETLRLPLGLRLGQEDEKDEDRQSHIAALEKDSSVVGSVLLKPLSQARVKLRQMAVSPPLTAKRHRIRSGAVR